MDRYLVKSAGELADAVRNAAELDTIELDATQLRDWTIALSDTGWQLCRDEDSVSFDGLAGARLRIVCNRTPYLLAGDNGHASIQRAIDQAEGGEVILVAPGTYEEGRAFTAEELGSADLPPGEYGLVINKAVTLQGVAEDGSPIVDRDDVCAAVVVKCRNPLVHSSFAVTRPGALVRGLVFMPAASCGEARGAGPSARVFAVAEQPFCLLASVIEQSGSVRTASALYFHDRGKANARADSIVRGCHIHGSVVVAGEVPAGALPLVLVDNDIVGDLLPPVVAGGIAMSAVEGDNTLRTIDPEPISMHELTNAEVLSFLDSTIDLNAPVRRLDGAGEVRGSYATIQSAIDAAVAGERIVVGPGTYLEDLYIGTGITLSGVSAGRPGVSDRRGVESAIAGHIVVACDVKDVVIDGFAIVGSVTTERSATARQHLALRNCVINANGASAAVFVPAGSGITIANNLIVGGADECIYVPCGFDDLAIVGNRICAAEGAVAIALHGGSGKDSVNIFGNVILGGDYGVIVEVDSGLAQVGDVITIAGNQFGEVRDGVVAGAPAVAAIYADGPVPSALHRSLGASLDLNTYNVSVGAVGVDVTFDLGRQGSSRLPRGSARS